MDGPCSRDRAKEVAEFDETKAGVKGLVDSGVTRVPGFFIDPAVRYLNKEPLTFSPIETETRPGLEIPVIDMRGFDGARRAPVVEKISKASRSGGIFQMINHGIPLDVLEGMLECVKRFHEQPSEVKREWYSRDYRKPVRYYCNGDLFVSRAANWRDSIAFNFQDGPIDPDAIPLVCRDEVQEYMKEMTKLREVLVELVSEALGLSSDYLSRLECMKTESLVCHYYPPCPEPGLTLGTSKHSDPSFLTVLLQDTNGGLQVLYQDQWVNVIPVRGALITHIGDLLQLISNDKFRSVEHRVVLDEGAVGPRVSAACFFYPSASMKLRRYGPIKELLAINNSPPVYRETHITEYLAYYRSKGLDGTSALRHFRMHEKS